MEKIVTFSGDYEFLSNFFPSPVEFEGHVYPTVEHAFQAAKTLDPAERDKIRALPTPGQAKRAGKRVQLRPDWNEARVLVMGELVRRKFESTELRRLLLATGNAELVEGNTWGDRFWGVCKGTGENRLGKILEAVRHVYSTSSENPEEPRND